MEKENFIQRRSVPIFIGILILSGFAVAFIYLIKSLDFNESKYPVLVYFWGISQILIVIGSSGFAFFLLMQWKTCIDHAQMMQEKQADNIQKEKMQKLLNLDAEARRVFERERNQVNDMFRLFELAKEKPEEKTDNTKVKEDGAVLKHIDNNVFTKKNEIINIEKLASLIDQYHNLISKQQTKTT